MDTPPLHPARALAGKLEQADLKLGLHLAGDRRAPAVRVASKVGKLGDQEPLYAGAAVVALAGLVTGRSRVVGLGASIGLAVLIADLGKSGLKRLVTRSRPHVLLDEGRYERALGASDDKTRQSFPSGHVAGAVATAATCARLAPRSTPFGAAACVFLGWSRMSKGAHWPSDVAAGVLIGLAAERAAAIVERLALSHFRRTHRGAVAWLGR